MFHLVKNHSLTPVNQHSRERTLRRMNLAEPRVSFNDLFNRLKMEKSDGIPFC